MKGRWLTLALMGAALTAAALAAACGSGTASDADSAEAGGALPDTLRVGTLYSPTSYFIYRDEEMGYDYTLVRSFASDKGLEVRLEVAPSLGRLVEMLDSGLIDVAAYEIPVTAEYRPRVVACGPQTVTHQVLVQPKKATKEWPRITDATQLLGRDVYVEAGSKYQYRMENLDAELGGGINLHLIDRDTLITEDLIDMVSRREIPLTIVDSDIARLNATYYKDLDVTVPVSLAQRASWGVSPGRQWLADSIDAWFASEEPRRRQGELLKRYFELAKDTPHPFVVSFRGGRISPYDNLFRRHAKEIGWDWRLIAAQGYAESQFDSSRVSWAGARGIMQIMPRTARAYGLSPQSVTNPEANIEAATRIVADLDKSLRRLVPDAGERRKFVVAAYNSGLAHVLDAIDLARWHGLDPRRWEANVEQALLMKANPEIYSDPRLRAGYFRGRQTVAYVREVFDFYHSAQRQIHA